MGDAQLDPFVPVSAKVGPNIVLAGDGTVLCEQTRLKATSIIGEGVMIGQEAWVRAGAAVMRSVPPDAIVEGKPARLALRTESDTRPDPRPIDIYLLYLLDRFTADRARYLGILEGGA